MRLLSKSFPMLLIAVALGGCASRSEAPASANVGGDDDAICRANGVVAGSPAYVACRKDRDNLRGNAITRADRAQRNLGEFMLDHPDTH